MGSNQSTVKSHNLSAILRLLLRHGRVSRARLAELTGLSSTTITNLVADLLEQGVLAEVAAQPGAERPKRKRRVGRPRTDLRLVPEARYAVGVHVGVGSVRVAVLDLCASPVNALSLDHPVDKPPRVVVAETAGLIERAIAESGVDRRKVIGVGVGASGLVNPHTGVNLRAPNLGWRDVPLRDWLNEHVSRPIFVDNNVRAMVLGEALFGAGKDVRALAFVYARIGVGAGLVVDGQLYRGGAGGAGEIGHNTVILDGGEPCRCGNTGCLETLVSEPVIVRLAKELARQDANGILVEHLRTGAGPTIERVFAAARAGDGATLAMLRQRACYVGVALANLVNILNPELIVLGGMLEQGQDLLLPAIESTLRRRAFANLGERVRLLPTTFGRRAGVIGAAALALHAFFYQRLD